MFDDSSVLARAPSQTSLRTKEQQRQVLMLPDDIYDDIYSSPIEELHTALLQTEPNWDEAEKLLEAGANPCDQAQSGSTAFTALAYHAYTLNSWKGTGGLLPKLLDYLLIITPVGGLNVNIKDDTHEQTALHMVLQAVPFLHDEDIILQIVGLLIEAGADVNLRDKNNSFYNGRMPLALACESLRFECVEALISAGAEVNEVKSLSHYSLPLHYALIGGAKLRQYKADAESGNLNELIRWHCINKDMVLDGCTRKKHYYEAIVKLLLDLGSRLPGKSECIFLEGGVDVVMNAYFEDFEDRLPVDSKTAAYLLAFKDPVKWVKGIQFCVSHKDNRLSKLPIEIRNTILSYAVNLLERASENSPID